MATQLYSTTSSPVSRLVQDIERGEIGLPDLQRPYVWSATGARDLFDSMYKGFPVGYLLFWGTDVEPGTKQIGAGAKERVPRQIIIDGQQRLTSLYAVMTGAEVMHEDYSTGRVRLAFRPSDETFAVSGAAIEKDAEYLPDISVLWQPDANILKKTVRAFLNRLAEKRELDEDERDRLESAIGQVHGLSMYSFQIVELSADISLEEVSEIFVRINSKGVKLKQSDFILTLMSVSWEEGRRELEKFCRDSQLPSRSVASPFNWFLEPQPSDLLRVTTALALRRAVLKQVYIVLSGRDPETGKASAALREKQFAKLQEAQQSVLDLTNWHEFLQCLERAGFRGAKMISSDNAILYSYAMWLIGRIDYKVPLDRLREAIARWFFMAHATGRYSGSLESQVEQDLSRFRDISAGDPDAFIAVLDKIVSDTLTSDYWSITLPNELNASASKSPALLSYIAALNILDADALLSRGKVRSRLDPAVTTKRGIERHHLFPKGYLLNALGIRDSRKINQIANMAMVEWHKNIDISDQAPSVYWPTQAAAKQIDSVRLAQQQYWHALPDGWESMEYDHFLAARRELMAGVVRDAFAQLADSSYNPSYPAPSTCAASMSRSGGSRFPLHKLIDAGLLEPGALLEPSWSGHSVTASVNGRGLIEVDGETYDTPSGAARATGKHTNGWEFWSVVTPQGPVSLDKLRSEYTSETLW
ncbi:GmrSD restriction endonuclease domain-containing protein [Kitasatospora brasiliensis]|uniref:GmrSD restriction endonuclease domain-containing protein n=1 Tax=Kitasatospora brasiliensis TaxID=3058040 RepID=UPI00293158C1|nr:DUF262 domain-containing protein [Kitasatospora sp. K002]